MGSKVSQRNHCNFDFWSFMKMFMPICFGYQHMSTV